MYGFHLSNEVIFLWSMLVPITFAYLAAYPYSRAILHGIACATNEYRRLNNESPWDRYEREFGEMRRILAVWTLGSIFIGSLATALPYPAEICTLPMNTGNDAREWAAVGFMFMWGQAALTLAILAGITRCASKHDSPLSCMLFGSIPGILAFILVFGMTCSPVSFGTFPFTYILFIAWGIYSFVTMNRWSDEATWAEPYS